MTCEWGFALISDWSEWGFEQFCDRNEWGFAQFYKFILIIKRRDRLKIQKKGKFILSDCKKNKKKNG